MWSGVIAVDLYGVFYRLKLLCVRMRSEKRTRAKKDESDHAQKNVQTVKRKGTTGLKRKGTRKTSIHRYVLIYGRIANHSLPHPNLCPFSRKRTRLTGNGLAPKRRRSAGEPRKSEIERTRRFIATNANVISTRSVTMISEEGVVGSTMRRRRRNEKRSRSRLPTSCS